MIQLLHHSTIVVKDIEKSLHFYRDILGFTVTLDQNIKGSEISTILGIPDADLRIVLLQVGAQETGLVGLISFNAPAVNAAPAVRSGPFPHALVFVTDAIEEVYRRLLAAGEEPISPPVELLIPRAGKVLIFACRDPDGGLVEIDQFL